MYLCVSEPDSLNIQMDCCVSVCIVLLYYIRIKISNYYLSFYIHFQLSMSSHHSIRFDSTSFAAIEASRKTKGIY